MKSTGCFAYRQIMVSDSIMRNKKKICDPCILFTNLLGLLLSPLLPPGANGTF